MGGEYHFSVNIAPGGGVYFISPETQLDYDFIGGQECMRGLQNLETFVVPYHWTVWQ